MFSLSPTNLSSASCPVRHERKKEFEPPVLRRLRAFLSPSDPARSCFWSPIAKRNKLPVATYDEGQTLFPAGHATWRMTNVGNTVSRVVTVRHETMTSMGMVARRCFDIHETSTIHAYVTRSGKVERASRGLRSRESWTELVIEFCPVRLMDCQ